MIRRGIGVQSFVSAGVSTDADAQAFIDAAGITDATQQSAINTLVTDLKTYGIWTKMKACYPFVGGTSSTHKWNLKDPRDLDAAYRLVFSGGLNHTSTGIISNGVNGYYDTKFNCSSNGSLNNQSFGVYIRTNLDGSGASLDFGTEFTSGALTQIYSKFDNGGVQSLLMRINDNGFIATSNSDSRGFYAASRLSSVSFLQQKNNTITTTNVSSISLPTQNILGFKNTTIYTAREQAFAFIGDGLTDTELTNLYTAVQAYQTTLNRNI